MRKLTVFNNVTLDGYFCDDKGDMSWAHNDSDDFNDFVKTNARAGGEFLFGRVTYEMMASYWPTEQAIKGSPAVAKTMNGQPKYVFSKTMKSAAWQNTRLFKGDLESNVKKLKAEAGRDLVIFGSGSLVTQLTSLKLIDQYQFVVVPIAIGSGKTLFSEVKEAVGFKLIESRSFTNGNLFLRYDALSK